VTSVEVIRVVDVARGIVEQMEPEQVGEVEPVARVFSRAVVRRARRPSNEPTASAIDVGQAVLAAVALDVTVDICEDLVITVGENAVKSGKDWLHRRRGKKKITPETPVRVLSDEQVELIRKDAVAAAIAHGLTPERAEKFADALVASWPRSK